MEAAHKVAPTRLSYALDRERLLGPLMLSPAIAYIVLLVGVPFVMAILLSLSDARAGSLSFSLIGMQNFVDIVQDPTFQRSLFNTFVFTFVSQLFVLILANTLAFLLFKKFPGRPLVRFLILLPWAAPIALATLSWVWIFDSTFSVLNWILRAVHILGPQQWIYWLGDPFWAMSAIIIIHVWRMMPFATVIILAGLTSIPQDLQDASVIDGAGFFRRLFEIIFPLLMPIMMVALLFGVVFTSTDMSVVYLMTNGGPHNSTHVLSSLAFQQGILGGDLGQGAAIAVFLFPVLVVGAIVMLRVARRTEVGV